MLLYAQEIKDNVWACRNFSCHVERTSFVEDKRAYQESIGISLQENANSEMNKDFQTGSRDSCIVETQKFKNSKDFDQQIIVSTGLHFENLEDHYNFNNFSDFVNRGETSGSPQVWL